MRTITLSEEDFEGLLLALGVAMSTVLMQKDLDLAARMLHLANAVNGDNVNWESYDEGFIRTVTR
jgi:hypothetical protein